MIFNLFKSKPTLKELIPNGFVDIHSHILPGIDDGAKNIDESLEMISEMKKMGFSKVIGTPHTYPGLYNNSSEIINKSYKKLIDNLDTEVKIDYASEYLIDESLIKMAESKSLLTLKDNFVLVEMSFLNPPNNLFDIIFKLRLNNYIPILAHPERYRFWFHKKENFNKLLDMGSKFQINLFSLTGYYGKDIMTMANYFLKNNMVDYTGTDIHNISQLEVFNKKILIKEIDILQKKLSANNIFKQ